MTATGTSRRDQIRRRHAAAEAEEHRRRRRRSALVTGIALAAVVGAGAAMMLSSRSTTTATVRQAPGFSLTSTAGERVSLTDYRGRDVLLYFNEGAGCGSCFQQMAAIEKERTAFESLGVTVLPIVMSTREQTTADMRRYGVRTPFLLDDGRVAGAYGVLGKGMHAGLPGHSFVLVDGSGRQRWMGEYPSMWRPPTELLQHLRDHMTR